MSLPSQRPESGWDGPEQVQALEALGLDRSEQREKFARGGSVAFDFRGPTWDGIAIAQWVGSRLRCGIYHIRSRAAGNQTLKIFETRARAVAIALSATELELFGAEVTNSRLEAVLIRKGFAPRRDVAPDDLGNGAMDVLSRVEPV